MRAFITSSASPRRGSRVAATFSLPVSSLNSVDLEEEKKRLTLQAKTSFGGTPPPFTAWRLEVGDDGVERLHIPRFYGLQRFGRAETDGRTEGKEINITFTGTLTPLQVQAKSALLDRHMNEEGDGGAMIGLYCGGGKTVLGVQMVAVKKRKACVLVHKAVLRDQWKEAFERFCPGVRVGFVQGKTWQVEGYDVVIAMIMTVAKRQYASNVFDEFGFVIVDEAHHVAAPIMNLALASFNARWILGLTATKDRADGLTPLLHWSLGPEAFHAQREAEGVQVSIALFPNATREILTRCGKPLVAAMINQLASNPARNAFIADRIVSMRRNGRIIMVLSDRIVQLDILKRLLLDRGIPDESIGLFKGGMRDDMRREQLAREVVLCSYGMANEGVDKREADTCIMATPKSRVIQCIGRVQRPCETKKTPLVLDVVDNVSIFVPLRWKRQKMYNTAGYEVQVVATDKATEEVWFK